jgi:preprotein translocase SecE subunit
MNAVSSNLNSNSNSNSKIITLCIVSFSILIGFTISSLLRALSGAFGPVAVAMNYDAFKHGLPVVVSLGLFLSLQFNKKFLVWADEVAAEIKKVVWPSSKDTRSMTVVVIIMVIISSIIISVFDLFSSFVLNQLLK